MNHIHPTAVIYPNVVLGDGNWIGAGAVIGSPGEHRKFDPREPAEWSVLIGDNNEIREYAVVYAGTVQHTIVEDGVLLQHGTHVSHDCFVGSGATLSPYATIAGHVTVGAGAVLGMGSMVHQHRSIGAGVMVGMGSVVTKDIPAGEKWYGNPARCHGLNERP